VKHAKIATTIGMNLRAGILTMEGRKGAHYYHYKNKAKQTWLVHHSFHTVQEHPAIRETKNIKLAFLNYEKRNINVALSGDSREHKPGCIRTKSIKINRFNSENMSN